MTEEEKNELAQADEAARELKSMMLDRDSGVMSAAQVRRQMGLVQSLMRDVLIDEKHYGVPHGFPPGTKPFLYDAGSQKIRLMFNLRAEYSIVEKHQSDTFLGYVVMCKLYDRGSGQFVGEGMGACNSRERKYRWRTVPSFKAMPGDKESAVAITKKQNQNGEYEIYKIENDPWDFQQTILAMAQVRSSKKATRDALAASDVLGIDEDVADGLIEEADYEDVTNKKRSTQAAEKLSQVRDAAKGKRKPVKPKEQPEHVLKVAQVAPQWKDATGGDAEAFGEIVREVTKGRTVQYTEVNEEEADLLVQLLHDKIAEAPDNRP